MATANLLVFLHAFLPELEQTELEERLRMLPGVLAVQLDHEHPHTLTLSYDSNHIHADAILNAVRQRDPQASLPGL
jgi:hypothetical protein